MDKGGAKPVCAQEALDLLNCVAESPSYDQDKCLALLNSLRECVLAKVLLFLSYPIPNCSIVFELIQVSFEACGNIKEISVFHDLMISLVEKSLDFFLSQFHM